MNLNKCILTKNECYIKRRTIKIKGIMWHSTGANNPKLSRYVQPDDGKLGDNPYNNDWNQYRPGGRQVCVHAFIGKLKDGSVATYQTLPWDCRGWHGGKSAANNEYIGFEICEDGLYDKNYFNAVYKEAVELTAYLCKKFNLDPMGKNVIICHQDGYKLGIASNHSDVYHWFNKHGKTMADVRRDVVKAMGNTQTPSKPSTNQLYRVRKTWKDAKSQIGAYASLENAKAACKVGYSVFDWNGKAVYSNQNKPAQKPSNNNIKVDGSWGIECTKATQRFLKTEVDGIVSHQPLSNKKYLPNAYTGSWKFMDDSKDYKGGSAMVKELQEYIGASVDGYFGKESVKALQRFLNSKGYKFNVDGIMGEKTVTAWQKYLNAHN